MLEDQQNCQCGGYVTNGGGGGHEQDRLTDVNGSWIVQTQVGSLHFIPHGMGRHHRRVEWRSGVMCFHVRRLLTAF